MVRSGIRCEKRNGEMLDNVEVLYRDCIIFIGIDCIQRMIVVVDRSVGMDKPIKRLYLICSYARNFTISHCETT